MINHAILNTHPWPHQLAVLEQTLHAEYCALFMEQRTGKTKVIIDTAAQLFHAQTLDALVVVAPNDVHRDWVELQLPAHCGVPYKAAYWSKKAAMQHAWNSIIKSAMLQQKELRVLTINYEALIAAPVRKMIEKFMAGRATMLVLDESHRVKNPRAAATKAVMRLAPLAKYRRILTGTPYGNEPVDLFPQMQFLHTNILGLKTAAQFRAKYAELLNDNDYLFRHIQQRTGKRPAIVRKDRDGKPMWRNLDDLERRIAPHCVRIKRSDVVADLPEKQYITLQYDMSDAQRALYTQILHSIDPNLPHIARLNMVSTAQQVMSNILPAAYEVGVVQNRLVAEFIDAQADNPRLARLLDYVDGITGQFIVWCEFIAEVQQVWAALNEMGFVVATLTGNTPSADRALLKKKFALGEIDVVVGHKRVGGTGQDFSAADTMIFYSHGYSYIERAQAEDRTQHMQKRTSTAYIDLCARDSVDSIIINAVRNKEDAADNLLKSLSK